MDAMREKRYTNYSTLYYSKCGRDKLSIDSFAYCKAYQNTKL